MSISKELLSEVTGMKIGYIRLEDEERVLAYASRFPNAEFWNNKSINIYELAHKCKEWAFTKGYYLDSGKQDDGFRCFIATKEYSTMVKQNTEPEAIFKACEYILENKDKK
jgi:hypothetical protein